MSAHLTVYSMAISAERPLRLKAADQARLAAEAETASGRRTGTLLSRLSDALGGAWRHGIAADRVMGTRDSGLAVVGQPAS